MASYRRPKGTVTRPIPDWHLGSMANLTIIGPEISPGYQESGIVNNATDGSYLVVWDVSISANVVTGGDGSVMSSGFFLYVNPFGLVDSAGVSLNPINGVQYGFSYTTGDPTQHPQGSNFGPAWWGPVNWSWPHDWPFVVLPVGWTLGFYCDLENGSDNLHKASFTYEITRAL